jgi:chromate transporter
MSSPSLKQLSNVFFRIGNTTFGGGLVTITVLGREMVDRLGWISQTDYELAYAVARVTPGTSIIAFCAAAGWLVLGWVGAIAAVLALCVPSAVLAVLLLTVLDSGPSHPLISSVVTAAVAAVAGMMGAVVLIIVKPYTKGLAALLRTVVIGGSAFLASWRFNFNPLWILAAATLASLLWGIVRPEASLQKAAPVKR